MSELDPIKGIQNEMFKKFHVNADLEKMHEEICFALSSTDLSKIPMVAGETPPEMYSGRPPFEFNVDPAISSLRSKFNDDMQFRKYLILKGLTDVPWAFVVDLKSNMFRTKSKDLHPWNNIVEAMPYTKSIIESLPFSEIGRVVIYGSWADSLVPCHRDSPSSFEVDNHINFNPGGYRPIYLYDCPTKKKHYLPEDYKFYAYNTTDYHGVDALPHFSYTVRVDGIYKKNKILGTN